MALLEVRVTLPPGQNDNAPLAEIVGVCIALPMVTMVMAELAEQLPEVTVTLYAPALVTVMDCVVALFDQWFPVALLEVSSTLPP